MTYTTPDTVDGTKRWTETRWDQQVRANFIDHEDRINLYEDVRQLHTVGCEISGALGTNWVTLNIDTDVWEWEGWTTTATSLVPSGPTSGTNLYAIGGFIAALDTNSESESYYNLRIASSVGTRLLSEFYKGATQDTFQEYSAAYQELYTKGVFHTGFGGGDEAYYALSGFFHQPYNEPIVIEGSQPNSFGYASGDRVSVSSVGRIAFTLVRNYS